MAVTKVRTNKIMCQLLLIVSIFFFKYKYF